MNQYVIAYDIANKKRLVRLHRYLQQHATPIQRSIFLFYGSELQKMACITGALRLLNPKEDSLCCPVKLLFSISRLEKITRVRLVCIQTPRSHCLG